VLRCKAQKNNDLSPQRQSPGDIYRASETLSVACPSMRDLDSMIDATSRCLPMRRDKVNSKWSAGDYSDDSLIFCL